MRKIKFSAIALFSILAINAYAYSGHGYTILSESETMSPGTVGGHRDVTSQKKSRFSAPTASVENQTYSISKPHQLIAHHDVFIQNRTGQAQVYTYTLELMASPFNYYNVTRKIILQPGGAFETNEDTFLNTLTKVTPGDYHLTAMTLVSVPDLNTYIARADLNVVK